MENRTIIDILIEYAKQDPLTPILFDDAHSRGITYAQLDDLSGRVYACLKKNKIGTEDFVLINLPRGVFILIAMIGVWKSGAAWALVEDTYAPERIDFIRSDCESKFELNMENWDMVMHTEPLEGHAAPDMHDAAYAVYTSGTTGNPKGVIHEYGNLQRAIDTLRVDGHSPFRGKDRLAVLSPLNFVATIMILLATLAFHGARIYIVSYNTTKNSSALARFFLTRRITHTFLTPSYARKLGSNTGPFLHTLVVGSDLKDVKNPQQGGEAC